MRWTRIMAVKTWLVPMKVSKTNGIYSKFCQNNHCSILDNRYWTINQSESDPRTPKSIIYAVKKVVVSIIIGITHFGWNRNRPSRLFNTRLEKNKMAYIGMYKKIKHTAYSRRTLVHKYIQVGRLYSRKINSKWLNGIRNQILQTTK